MTAFLLMCMVSLLGGSLQQRRRPRPPEDLWRLRARVEQPGRRKGAACTVLKKIVPDGEYHAVGGLIVRDGRLPAAYDGDCALRDSNGQDALRLALVHKGDPRYVDAETTLTTGGQDGFVKISDTTYAFSDSTGEGAVRAVAVQPDRLVILQVLHPATGAGVKQIGTQMATVVDGVGQGG